MYNAFKCIAKYQSGMAHERLRSRITFTRYPRALTDAGGVVGRRARETTRRHRAIQQNARAAMFTQMPVDPPKRVASLPFAFRSTRSRL